MPVNSAELFATPPVTYPVLPIPPRPNSSRPLYLLSLGVERLLQLLPSQRSLWRAASLTGRALYALQGQRRRQALANLQHIYGQRMGNSERRRITRESFAHMAALWLEMAWDNQRHGLTDAQWVRLSGSGHLDEARERGKGVLLAMPHMGNWLLAIWALSQRGYPVAALHRRTNIPGLADYVDHFSARWGLDYITTPLDAAGSRACLTTLRRNNLLMIMADRRSKDCRANFLGQPAWSAQGIASLHLRTGAPIVPAVALRHRDHHEVVIGEPLAPALKGDRKADTTAILQAMNDRFGEWIHAHPEQWLWQHDRWRERRADMAAAAAGKQPGEAPQTTVDRADK